MLAYGASKAGKSTLAATAPYPRLMLDVEHGHKFLPLQVRYWDPIRDHPPEADGTWDTCVVPVRTYEDMLKTYAWMQTGRHQFRSLIIDSISELQVKLIEQLAGSEQMKMQHWGDLLRNMGNLLRNIRDLTMHPTNPLEAVVLTAMAKEASDGRLHPYLQGQLGTQVSYFWDIVGFIRVEEFPHPDPSRGTYKVRRMYVESTNFAEAGERVQGRLGSVVEQADMNVEMMLDRIYGIPIPLSVADEPEEEPAAVSA